MLDVMYLRKLGPNPYLLVICCPFSGYTWVRFLKKIRSDSVARAFEQVLEQYDHHFKGILRNVVTDRGGEFLGAEFQALLKRRGIKSRLSSGLSPSKTSIPERKIRTVNKNIFSYVKN